MVFLGHPIEIWAAILIAVMIKLRSSKNLTKYGYATTIGVAVLSGLFLYAPLITLIGLSASWEIPIAILIGLTAENIMNNIVAISSDIDLLKSFTEKFVKTKKGDES